MPVRGTLILSHRHSEVEWPVPFLAAFITFPVLLPGTHLLLGGKWANIPTMIRGFGSNHRCFAQQSSALTTWPLDQDLEIPTYNKVMVGSQISFHILRSAYPDRKPILSQWLCDPAWPDTFGDYCRNTAPKRSSKT